MRHFQALFNHCDDYYEDGDDKEDEQHQKEKQKSFSSEQSSGADALQKFGQNAMIVEVWIPATRDGLNTKEILNQK